MATKGKKAPAVSGQRPNVWTAVRVLIGLLFVVSGFEKLTGHYQNFAYVIEQYQMVSAGQAALLARTLPWVELVAGTFFVLGLWTRASAAAIFAMFGVFLVAVGQAIARGLPMDECGCFGELISLPLPAVFAMDLTLSALLVWGTYRAKPGFKALSADAAYE